MILSGKVKWHAIRLRQKMIENKQADRPIVFKSHRRIGGSSELRGEDIASERRKVIFSAIFAGSLVLVFWIVKIYEVVFDWNTSFLALRPRSVAGLPGILMEPLLHGDFNHLISNSVPFFLLMMATLYFYRGIGFRVLGWIWLITGVLVWLFARPHLHIGASGVVYGLASFLALSGLLRNDTRLMAISLLVVFLYGGMVWGVLPLFQHVSWESHLAGALAGVFCAIKYRHEGPPKIRYFEEDEEEDEAIPEEIWNAHAADESGKSHVTLPHTGGIRYHYLPKSEDEATKG